MKKDFGSIDKALNTNSIVDALKGLPLKGEDSKSALKLSQINVQLLDDSKSLVLRLPILTATQGQAVIEVVTPLVGPLQPGGQSVDTIGPSLGGQLLNSSIISLVAAFMSTVDTPINWGASYIANDIYKRFINPNAEKKDLV